MPVVGQKNSVQPAASKVTGPWREERGGAEPQRRRTPPALGARGTAVNPALGSPRVLPEQTRIPHAGWVSSSGEASRTRRRNAASVQTRSEQRPPQHCKALLPRRVDGLW